MTEEKHIVKERIIRLYDADITELKAVLKDVNQLAGVDVALYAKDGEYLVRINVSCGGEAAATQLCESSCDMIFKAQSEQCYGQGNDTLAHVVSGLLMLKSTQLAVANSELGEALSAEFATTKRGAIVFDNGASTYSRKRGHASHLRAKDKTVSRYGQNSLQAATDMAFAAMQLGKARFGAASTPADAAGQRWAVVTCGSKVYARQLRAHASLRELALSVLDLVRRVADKVDIASDTHRFNKGKVSLEPPRKISSILLATFITLLIAAVAALAIYYYFNIYTLPKGLDGQPVGTLISQSK